MIALALDRIDSLYLFGGSLLALPLLSAAVYWTRRAVLDLLDARHEPAPVDEPVKVTYPPMDAATDVMPALVGDVLVTDELGEWEPAAYPLVDAYIADDVYGSTPWETLRRRTFDSDWSPAWTVQPREVVTR